jgi:hypothetical protein
MIHERFYHLRGLAMPFTSRRGRLGRYLAVGGVFAATAAAAASASAAAFVIKTLAQLQNIEKNLAGDYILGADIDATATRTWNGGAGFIPIGANRINPSQYLPFTGHFNGAGHKITNLTFGRAGTWTYTGLFAYIGPNGVVENLTLVDASVTSSYQGFTQGKANTGYVTPLVAINTGKVINVSASGVVALNGYQNIVTGLVGYNQGLVTNSASSAAVTGNSINSSPNLFAVAGLVGVNVVNGKAVGTISKSVATGRVAGSIANGGSMGGGYAGGLVGLNQGVIQASSSAQPVTCAGCIVGGLVGYNAGPTGIVRGSKSASAVSSSINGRIGGLIGFNAMKATVTTSSASGVATSTGGNSDVGGLVGENDGIVETSHAATKVSGITGNGSAASTSAVGGLVGTNDVDGVVRTSYATGGVSDNLSGGVSVGGLVGVNTGPGSVNECYATGNVVATGIQSAVGGLIGTNSYSHGYGLVQNSYAHGNVTGGMQGQVGELIGFNDTATLKFSYGTGKLKGGKDALIGGDVGSNAGTVAGTYWDITVTKLINGAGKGSQTGMSYQGEAELKSGKLPAMFSPKIWKAKKGSFPYLVATPAG